MDFAIVSPFLSLVDAFKRPPSEDSAHVGAKEATQTTDSPPGSVHAFRRTPASSAELSPRPSGQELWLSREALPECSAARGAPEPSEPSGAKFLISEVPLKSAEVSARFFCPELHTDQSKIHLDSPELSSRPSGEELSTSRGMDAPASPRHEPSRSDQIDQSQIHVDPKGLFFLQPPTKGCEICL